MKNTEFTIQNVPHQRGLVIGIGGTGAEVVSGNRRRTVERFGSLQNVPMIRYLYLDTNPTWYQDQKTKVDQGVRLGEDEFVDLQIPATTELYRGMKRGNYPHYSWFDLGKLENLRSGVVDGAGTVRQMARLAFWTKYSDVKAKIENQLKALKQDSVATFMREKHGIRLDDGINIYVVAGLGGGTGSGLWVETAYLVQKIVQELAITGSNQVVGYGVLPQAYRDLTGANALANGYAALKELNYHCYLYAPNNPLAAVFGEPVWDADYLRTPVHRVKFTRQPPFKFCYLLDDRNEHVDLHRKDIYQMIDSAIFHEFNGSFAPFKRSLRANIGNQLTRNDDADCPISFMSFGQSSALVPLEEMKQVLAHQLASEVVQSWLGAKVQSTLDEASSLADHDTDFAASVATSILDQSHDEKLTGSVRGWLVRDFLKTHGINPAGLLAAVVQEQRERLTDVPYSLLEGIKQEWIAEEWPLNSFVSRVTNAREQWRKDFDDDSSDRMKWGERIRKLDANKDAAFKGYKKLFREEAYRLFENCSQYGPAWAVCALEQMQSGLKQLQKLLVDEAGSANTIANQLNDVVLINDVATNRGPALSSIIEARESSELAALDAEVKKWSVIGKRKAVTGAAYEYLKWCAHWCRARVEERARREAAELAEALVAFLGELRNELITHAALLAQIEADLLAAARAWNEKAVRTRNVGAVLYSPALLQWLDSRLRQCRGDDYSAQAIGEKALQELGKKVRDLDRNDVPRILSRLVQLAMDAVGDLSESGLNDTQFGAHDLLSLIHNSDDSLDEILRQIVRKSAPYVRLTSALEDGGWTKDSDMMRCIDGAGIRGGGLQENDPDKDHARVITSLMRNGWNVRDGIRSIDDGGQIVFFQECGGFPLRALAGIQEMKNAYEEHRRKPNTTPLHIVTDEAAQRYPDLFPPEQQMLERARILQTVAAPLGLIAQRDFPSQGATGPNRLYAFMRHIEELGKEQPVPLGNTLEAVGMKLATSSELLDELEAATDRLIHSASAADKIKFALQLCKRLDETLEAARTQNPGCDPENCAEYLAEQSRVRAFMKRHGLKVPRSCNGQQEQSLPPVGAERFAL